MTATPRQPNLRDPLQFLAFGLGSGLAPKAPGTAGSLAALLFFPLLLQLTPLGYLLVILVSGIAGGFICEHAAKQLDVHDDGRIVWDEFVGQWIALFPLSMWLSAGAVMQWHTLLLLVAAGFALFRLFDVWKPWPIRLLDRHVPGGFGIMVDDVLAGIFAAIALWWVIQGVWA